MLPRPRLDWIELIEEEEWDAKTDALELDVTIMEEEDARYALDRDVDHPRMMVGAGELKLPWLARDSRLSRVSFKQAKIASKKKENKRNMILFSIRSASVRRQLSILTVNVTANVKKIK